MRPTITVILTLGVTECLFITMVTGAVSGGPQGSLPCTQNPSRTPGPRTAVRRRER